MTLTWFGKLALRITILSWYPSGYKKTKPNQQQKKSQTLHHVLFGFFSPIFPPLVQNTVFNKKKIIRDSEIYMRLI